MDAAFCSPRSPALLAGRVVGADGTAPASNSRATPTGIEIGEAAPDTEVIEVATGAGTQNASL